MGEIKGFVKEIFEFINMMPEVKTCKIDGSLRSGNNDEYSDLDLVIDVSGVDNGVFLTKLPQLFEEQYDVIFFDYTPSLAPDKYIVSIAVNKENPFMIVDLSCVAAPHCDTVSKQDLASLNNKYDHTLKLFVANLKHLLRGMDCYDDIYKMYSRIFGRDLEAYDEEWMMQEIYRWLQENAESRHEDYLALFEGYL